MLTATPYLWLYSQWRIWQLNVHRPSAMQEAELLSLIRRAKSTRFGNDHDFAALKSVADFQDCVPLRGYDDFWNDYWKADFPRLENCTWPGTIPYFALTSGTTTGVTKYIPCSHDMLRANSRAAQDILVYHLLNRPASRILTGKNFMLGGSTDLREEAPGKDHRAGDFGLQAPKVEAIAPGTFRAWMKSRGQLGGQHKVPRIINDAELFANLKAFLSHAQTKRDEQVQSR